MRPDHCKHDTQAAILLNLMRPAERAARLLVLVAWMALITYWSAQNSLPIDQPVVANLLHGSQHRVAHLFAFGMVALLARWAFAGMSGAVFWALLLTSVFGATDEWHQSLTPWRHAGVDDWAWDTVSAAVALCVQSRVRTLRWPSYVRPLAPLAVGAAFVLGVGLAFQPGMALPSEVNRSAVRGVTTQVAQRALDFARSTRNVARQVRSTLAG
jgi:VanZ family protein